MKDTMTMQQMPKKMVNTYVHNQLLGLTPGQLLLTVYDVAIKSCQQKDIPKATRAISELISALNFEHKDISLGLFRLYQYIIDQIRNRKFELAISFLKELRDTWAIAINSYN